MERIKASFRLLNRHKQVFALASLCFLCVEEFKVYVTQCLNFINGSSLVSGLIAAHDLCEIAFMSKTGAACVTSYVFNFNSFVFIWSIIVRSLFATLSSIMLHDTFAASLVVEREFLFLIHHRLGLKIGARRVLIKVVLLYLSWVFYLFCEIQNGS